VKQRLGAYTDLNFHEGFKSESFTNGKAILAMINEFCPGVIDYKSYHAGPSDKLVNCTAAVKLAQEHVKIPDIIDPEELSSGKLEEKNLVLYLSLFYNAFKDKTTGETKESLLKKLQELEEKFRILAAENEALKAAKHTLESTTHNLSEKLTVSTEEKSHAITSKTEVTTSLSKLKETYQTATTDLNSQITNLTEQIAMLKSSSDSSVTHLQNEKDHAAHERDSVREELKKTKDQLTKEKEELQAQQDELAASIARNKKAKEELEEVRKRQQETHQKTISVLRTHLLHHVRDMNVWRPLLEADREFKESEILLKTEAEIEKLSLTDQVAELDTAILEDSKRLDKLVREREMEAAEVVSVNIGKKKKRIKKENPVDDISGYMEVEKKEEGEPAHSSKDMEKSSKKKTKK